MRRNGGYIGYAVTTSTSSAPGIYSLSQQYRAQANAAWPVASNIDSAIFSVAGASAVYYAPMTQANEFGASNVPKVYTSPSSSADSTLTGTSLSQGTNDGYYSLSNRPGSTYGTGTFSFTIGSAIGTGDYSLEFWASAVQPASGANSGFFAIGPDQTGYQTGYGSGTAYYFTGGSGALIAGPFTFTYGSWIHYCVTRVSGTFRVFINGTYLGGGSATNNIAGTQVRMLDYATVNQVIATYMRKMRLCVGGVPYGSTNSNFTPFAI